MPESELDIKTPDPEGPFYRQTRVAKRSAAGRLSRLRITPARPFPDAVYSPATPLHPGPLEPVARALDALWDDEDALVNPKGAWAALTDVAEPVGTIRVPSHARPRGSRARSKAPGRPGKRLADHIEDAKRGLLAMQASRPAIARMADSYARAVDPTASGPLTPAQRARAAPARGDKKRWLIATAPQVVPTMSKEEAVAPVRGLTRVVSTEIVADREKSEGDGPLEQRGMRMIVPPVWREYAINLADYLGRSFGQIGPAGDIDLGFMVTGTKEYIARLPLLLILTLQGWWGGRETTYENFLLSDRVCKNYCLRLDITAEEEAKCKLFAPYVAYTMGAESRNKLLASAKGKVRPIWPWNYAKKAAMALLVSSFPSMCTAAAVTANAPLAVGVAVTAGAAAIPILGAAVAMAGGYLACKSLVRHFKPARAVVACVPSTKTPPVPRDGADYRVIDTNKEPSKPSSPVLAVGIPVVGCEPTIYSGNRDNMVAALQARSFANPPKCDPTFRKLFIRRAYQRLQRWLGRPFHVQVPRELDDWVKFANAWVDGSNSTRVVKERNREAIARLAESGITSHTPLTKEQIYEWTKRDATVKRETVLKDPTGAPRQIMGATPEFCVLVSPFVSAFAGVVKDKLQRRPKRQSPVIYAPGATGKAVAAWQLERTYRVGRNVDQIKWDLCQQEDTGREELGLFKAYGCPRATCQLLESNLSGVHGSSREGVRFATPYMRLSGDGHTTVGNTTCAMAMRAEGVACCIGREPTSDDMLDAAGGDDGSLLTNDPCEDFERVMAEAGFPVTSQVVSSPAELEFLGCRLTTSSIGPVYVPMAGRTIAKIAYSVRATEGTAAAIARGSAMSFGPASSAVPPLAAYVDTVLRLTQGVKAIMPLDEAWKMRDAYTGVPTADTWADLEAVYGWTRELQDCLEQSLAKVTSLGTLADIPSLRMLIERDFSREDPEISSASPITEEKYDDLNLVQIIVELPNQPSRVMEVAEGTNVRHLALLCGLPCDGMNVTIDGAPTSPAVGIPAGSTVTYRPQLAGGASAFISAASALSSGLARLKPAITNVLQGVPKDAVDAIVESALEAGWEEWADLSGDEKAPSVAQPCPVVCEVQVTLSGHKTIGVAKPDDTLATFVSRVCNIPERVLHKFDPIFNGRVLAWTSPVLSDFEIRVKGLGGSALWSWFNPGRPLEEPVRNTIVDWSSKPRYVVHPAGAQVSEVVTQEYGMAIMSKVIPFAGCHELCWADAMPSHGLRLVMKGLGGSNAGRISRNEKLLNMLENRAGILPTSKAYVMSLIDGFHDHSFPAGGRPDGIASASVRECIKTSYTVVSNQGSSANWDCSIVISPDMLPASYIAWTPKQSGSAYVTDFNLLTTSGTTSTVPFGGLMISSVAAGGTTGTTGVSSYYPLIPAGLEAGRRFVSTVPGPSRVTSVWIEVINTTAPLYAQGSATCWRQPQPALQTASTYTYAPGDSAAPTAPAVGAASTLVAPGPPNNLAEAMLLYGTKQWKAVDGALFCHTMSQDELPIIQGQCVNSLYYDDAPADSTLYGPNYYTQVVGSNEYAAFTQTYKSPFNMSGVYLSGLSAQTSFTVNVRTFIEIFPSQIGNPLTPIATPSAPYDSACMLLISEFFHDMPPGVPASENGFGDWFQDVVGKVASFVSPIAKTIGSVARFIPGVGQAVANVADVVGGISDRFIPQQELAVVEASPSAPQRMQVPRAPRNRQAEAMAAAVSRGNRQRAVSESRAAVRRAAITRGNRAARGPAARAPASRNTRGGTSFVV